MSRVSVLTLQVPVDRVDAVVGYYRDARVMEVSGAESAQLVVDDAVPGKIVCFALWTDDDGYARWQRDPRRASMSQGIADAAGGRIEAVVGDLRVVHSC
ncbi:hypothetical protein JVX90_11525 [Gordonia sp. PDNC005]|uniref:hypothetical protein n=1 Tax=unclassified Gordonia (in: high G+C Gram-positive bacteria) TaxID=2657482 RepID=UPI001965F8C1|nr:hypothetical protein [Gordonia sp. PDNC005]QRY61077.1 hypothetical protein JVX90_11525 [Gordonia sp. PDNC005]